MGVDDDVPRFRSALARAHAPALEHVWAVSDRWSRQNLLDDESVWRVAMIMGDSYTPFATFTLEREKV